MLQLVEVTSTAVYPSLLRCAALPSASLSGSLPLRLLSLLGLRLPSLKGGAIAAASATPLRTRSAACLLPRDPRPCRGGASAR